MKTYVKPKNYKPGQIKFKCRHCKKIAIRRSNDKICKECRAILTRKLTEEERHEIRMKVAKEVNTRIWGDRYRPGIERQAEADEKSVERTNNFNPGFKESLQTLKTLFKNTTEGQSS